MKNYKESLRVANKLYEEDMSSLWVIVISYYSMLYIANACLYKMGYKVQDKVAHKVTSDSLIVLVKNKLTNYIIENYEKASEEALLLSENLIESYDFERNKRSKFQYTTIEEIKKYKAKTSLGRAKEFALEIENLIDNFEKPRNFLKMTRKTSKF